MAFDIKKFIGRFVEEAKDHLGQMNSGLAALEQGAASSEQINSLFRSAHTLKGSSRMLKLEPITQLAHSLEDLLSALREQQVQVNHSVMDALYQGVDGLSNQVEQLVQHATVPDLNAQQLQLCQLLSALAQGQAAAEYVPEAALAVPESAPAAQTVVVEQATPRLTASDTVRVKLTKLDELIKLMGQLNASHAGMHEMVNTARRLELQAQQHVGVN